MLERNIQTGFKPGAMRRQALETVENTPENRGKELVQLGEELLRLLVVTGLGFKRNWYRH